MSVPEMIGYGVIAWLLAALAIVAWFALAHIGTPDDHEIGTDRWPRLDDK